jgi:N utilization substance protein B
LVLQGLCCLDAQGSKALELVVAFIDDSRDSPETISAARRLLQQAFADCPACDELLARHARHWELSRLAMVDRNILRLATSELRAGQVPYKAVISEAIALAKEFSSAESPRFVNGVLDAVAREVRGGAEDLSEESEEKEPDQDEDGPVGQQSD